MGFELITPELCIKCKGKLMCGLDFCPILEKHERASTIVSAVQGTQFIGATPPGFFVSWQNYPKVAVAPLSSLPANISEMSDAPEQWYGLPQEKIIAFRESLLRSYKSMPVALAANPSYELADFQEIAMSSSTMELDVNLARKPKAELSFDSFSAPMGPSAELEKLSILENSKIPQKLDAMHNDTAVKSNAALIELYTAGVPVSSLSKVLSSGALGVKKNRKLVPTRWSITAVDSNLSKYLVTEKVSQGKVIDSFRVFNSNYLDNNFWILLLPYPWSFEQIETWLPGGIWNESATQYNIMADHELNGGLKGYPENTEGAYFAARLAVAEYLSQRKENAACIVFREIGKSYAVPLGVWQIRENVRAALKQKPLDFSTIDLALDFLSKKLVVPLPQYKSISVLLKHFKQQTRLAQWF